MIIASTIFAQYNPLWEKDHEEELRRFLLNKPYVSEFENEIKYYENLGLSINSQPEFLTVGPLAIFTGRYFFVTFKIIFVYF